MHLPILWKVRGYIFFSHKILVHKGHNYPAILWAVESFSGFTILCFCKLVLHRIGTKIYTRLNKQLSMPFMYGDVTLKAKPSQAKPSQAIKGWSTTGTRASDRDPQAGRKSQLSRKGRTFRLVLYSVAKYIAFSSSTPRVNDAFSSSTPNVNLDFSSSTPRVNDVFSTSTQCANVNFHQALVHWV